MSVFMFHDSMISRLKALLVLGLTAFVQPVSAEPARAVVELFTSQGCASCPPADAVLGELARRSDIIALSFPVDYWDYRGWKDTLAHSSFTARQKAYAQARSDRQIYTPQLIVNGVKSCVGSDRAGIEQSIQTTTGGLSSLPVSVTTEEQNGVVSVSIDENAGTVTPQRAEVWLMPILRSQMVSIDRGENRGRTVTYANVVRGMNRLGDWSGGKAHFKLPANEARKSQDGKSADGYVVLVQTTEGTRPSTILGAAKSDGL